MSAIILGYLAMSYTFSGLVCYLACLKHSSQQLRLIGMPKYPALFANLGVTILWPIWLWREIDRELDLSSNPIYLSKVWERSLMQKNRSLWPKQFKRLQQDNLTIARIKIQVPTTYHSEPVISRLTSEYGLTFNITDALLKGDRQNDGLFHLELCGTPQQIQKGLDYLQQKEVKIWGKPNADGDNW